MAVFFVLLVLIVQIGFAVASRSMISASVDASARRLAWGGVSAEGEQVRLRAEVETLVPGATLTSVRADRSDRSATVLVVYEWTPPGPDLLPIEFSVERTRSVAIAP